MNEAALAVPPAGRLVENLMFFARTLRAAGLPIGPGRVVEALRAVEAVGIGRREDFYWTLHSVFVNRQDQRPIFDQAFHVFWRNPKLLERMMAMLLPTLTANEDADRGEELSRRLAEALRQDGGNGAAGDGEPPGEDEVEFDAAMTYSQRELLQGIDFEKMSGEELAAARRLVARMRLPIMDVPTRRFRPDPHGRRIDMRATLRASLRSGGVPALRRRNPRRRHPPLVIICDISGSMSRYSRIVLHFMHAVTNDRDRVFSFLFGTRLTNITRMLRHRDVDVAVDRVADTVQDWSGGTRIGHCLAEFNAKWSRRVLGQGALVLFISDGLDRDSGEGLTREIERLHKSCRRLIWLNPLLRYDAYEPKSLGAQAIMPHIDDFRPIHNLASLGELTEALAHPGRRRMAGTAWPAQRRRQADGFNGAVIK
ncbi:MAG TPA: VWA domain-containing protein [Dongiaceae bacterium]|nr:VWA domain-containing protein [Dongiaceae bacterium]